MATVIGKAQASASTRRVTHVPAGRIALEVRAGAWSCNRRSLRRVLCSGICCCVCVCGCYEGAREWLVDSAFATSKSSNDVSGKQTGAYWRALSSKAFGNATSAERLLAERMHPSHLPSGA
eukprot:3961840-Pleurochrysis_carterae.AAC.1